jgi:hypothetical protein
VRSCREQAGEQASLRQDQQRPDESESDGGKQVAAGGRCISQQQRINRAATDTGWRRASAARRAGLPPQSKRQILADRNGVNDDQLNAPADAHAADDAAKRA